METSLSDSIRRTVVRAKSRVKRQLVLRNALFGAALALLGPAALLLLGSERFPLWAAALALGPAAAWVYWRVRSQSPSDYQVAQTLDRRWDAADQVSTAYYFSGSDHAGAALAGQLVLAERAAAGHDVVDALPYRWSREATAAAGMLGLAVLLLGVRALQGPGFSLDQPLAPLPELGAETVVEALPPQTPPPGEQAPELLPATTEEASELAERSPDEDPSEAADPLAAAADSDEAYLPPEVEGLSLEDQDGDPLDFEGQEGVDSGESEAGEGEDAAGEDAAQPPEPSDESQDLLDRLADAFKDMLEDLSMDAPEGGEPGESESEGESGDPSEAGAESGEPSAEGAEEAGEQPGAEMEGGAAAEGEAQEAEGSQGGEDSSEPGEAGGEASASGTAEGEKSLAQQAEAEAALDALEEFYQQRAEQMSGEIMVETRTSSGSGREASSAAPMERSDRGGIVSRDEIPAEYRTFIESYFKAPEPKGRNQ